MNYGDLPEHVMSAVSITILEARRDFHSNIKNQRINVTTELSVFGLNAGLTDQNLFK